MYYSHTLSHFLPLENLNYIPSWNHFPSSVLASYYPWYEKAWKSPEILSICRQDKLYIIFFWYYPYQLSFQMNPYCIFECYCSFIFLQLVLWRNDDGQKIKLSHEYSFGFTKHRIIPSFLWGQRFSVFNCEIWDPLFKMRACRLNFEQSWGLRTHLSSIYSDEFLMRILIM